MIDIQGIKEALPHRYPMLLVDRVLEVSEDTIVAIKNVTINEPFFNGHFPQYPVMPGVLIMEALAQTAGVLELSKPENKGKLVFYAGMDKVKFKKVAIKNVTINEPFFNGHFPAYPVMPGVLIMEALAQTAGVLELSKPENKGKLVFYAGMDKVKFKKQVVPGDQLVMTATFVKRRGTIAVVEAKAEVDGKLAASGTLTFAIGN